MGDCGFDKAAKHEAFIRTEEAIFIYDESGPAKLRLLSPYTFFCLAYLGPGSDLPSFLISLVPALQSCALSRFIGIELHGEESSIAIHRTARVEI